MQYEIEGRKVFYREQKGVVLLGMEKKRGEQEGSEVGNQDECCCEGEERAQKWEEMVGQ